MALVACKGCAAQISPKAVSCPKCGHPNKKASHLSGGSVVMILLGAVFFVWWMAATEKNVTQKLSEIEATVATDMVEQYNIAKRAGDKTQICVQAGMVTAAYLQAKDEVNYRMWEQKQKADCKKAGIPM
jgi:hypothetical protein